MYKNWMVDAATSSASASNEAFDGFFNVFQRFFFGFALTGNGRFHAVRDVAPFWAGFRRTVNFWADM